VEYLIHFLLRFGHKLFTKLYFLFTRVIRKVRKAQHQNPEFSHTQGEIFKKKPAEKVFQHSTGDETQKIINFGVKLSFILSFIFS
jgi:hypothetical protein